MDFDKGLFAVVLAAATRVTNPWALLAFVSVLVIGFIAYRL